jgi:hypothetical protein
VHPPEPRRLGHVLDVAQVLIPGAYAWAVTVAPLVLQPGPRTVALVTVPLALCALVSGAILVRSRPRIGYALGIWAFIGLSLVSWSVEVTRLQIDRVEPVRAAAGAVGWALFALGWGIPWRTGVHPEDNPRAMLHPKLKPRNPPLWRSHAGVAIATVGAVACLALAWRSSEPDRALMLHGVALACAVGMVTSSASLGLAQGKRRVPLSPRQRFAFAFPWFMALLALLAIFVAWNLGS